ncbi:hypothetical protein [Bosea sp. RAC05]|uniref:hypothetical protein n=1 Tax=Bosea sp. RAC05 TaxID=1842539 RepID=UPI00083E4BF9|nr:hypothetical protein [Bosea sp. RAC05]AOG02929.1 hypothetical protein BSY19_5296 [Bosea sp. RAC05]
MTVMTNPGEYRSLLSQAQAVADALINLDSERSRKALSHSLGQLHDAIAAKDDRIGELTRLLTESRQETADIRRELNQNQLDSASHVETVRERLLAQHQDEVGRLKAAYGQEIAALVNSNKADRERVRAEHIHERDRLTEQVEAAELRAQEVRQAAAAMLVDEKARLTATFEAERQALTRSFDVERLALTTGFESERVAMRATFDEETGRLRSIVDDIKALALKDRAQLVSQYAQDTARLSEEHAAVIDRYKSSLEEMSSAHEAALRQQHEGFVERRRIFEMEVAASYGAQEQRLIELTAENDRINDELATLRRERAQFEEWMKRVMASVHTDVMALRDLGELAGEGSSAQGAISTLPVAIRADASEERMTAA